MLRRRVPVSRWGSRGQGDEQKSLRLCLQAFAKRLQACASVTHTWQSRNRGPRRTVALLDLRLVFAFQKCQPPLGLEGPGRETQNCRHFWTCSWSSREKGRGDDGEGDGGEDGGQDGEGDGGEDGGQDGEGDGGEDGGQDGEGDGEGDGGQDGEGDGEGDGGEDGGQAGEGDGGEDGGGDRGEDGREGRRGWRRDGDALRRKREYRG